MPGEFDARSLTRFQALPKLADGKGVQHRHLRIAGLTLVDDTRHDIQAALHRRRISLVLLVVVALRHRIRPQALMLAIERMCHGLAAAGLPPRYSVADM